MHIHLPNTGTRRPGAPGALRSAPGLQNFRLCNPFGEKGMEETAGQICQSCQDQAHSPRCGQRVLGHPAMLPTFLLLPRVPRPRQGSLHLAGKTVILPSGAVCCPFSCDIPHSLHCVILPSPPCHGVRPCAWVRPGLMLPEARVFSHSALRPGAWRWPGSSAEGCWGVLADRDLDACLLGLSPVSNEEGRSSEPTRPEGVFLHLQSLGKGKAEGDPKWPPAASHPTYPLSGPHVVL